MNAIRVSGLRKSFGAREVVHGIDFEVRSGECFGFLGHNGAGKTTTLEILEGYQSRNAGDLSVLGLDPSSPTSEWRCRIGIVLQEVELLPGLTVSETVQMFADLYPDPRSVGDTIELVGLSGLEKARVGALSGGEKRRVDLALGLIGNPELLFLDEPTSGFDPAARRAAWTTIKDLKGLGVTIVLTTHYMEEAQFLADRILILKDGTVAAQGTYDDLVREYGSNTEISFALAESNAQDIRVATGIDVEVTGARFTAASDNPQRDLHRLTTWAEQQQLILEDLSVHRASLEDVFLTVGSSRSGKDDGSDDGAGAL